MRLTLLLDNIRSLHNVGSIFRTADAVEVEEIILCGLTPTPPRHEIDKTALGATSTVKWRYIPNIRQALTELTNNGYTCVALEQTSESVSLFDYHFLGPTALVLGHERMGVSQAALENCQAVEIHMHGKSAHSLNVSVAAGIALYHIRENLAYTD